MIKLFEYLKAKFLPKKVDTEYLDKIEFWKGFNKQLVIAMREHKKKQMNKYYY